MPDPNDALDLGAWLAFVDEGGTATLVVTDREHPAAKSLLKPRRLSPSTAAAMEGGCHARWAVERSMPRTDDPFGAAELGSAAHAVMEEVMQRPSHQRTPEAIEFELSRVDQTHPELAVPDDIMERTRWRGEVAGKLAGIPAIMDLPSIDVYGTEIHFDDVSVAGVPINGYADLVARQPNGSLWVQDYKTGKVRKPYRDERDAESDQQRTYVMALAAKTGELPTRATLLYTAFGASKEVDVSPNALRETATVLRNAFTAMNSNAERGTYSMKASGLCGWCPLALVCPEGNRSRVVRAKTPAAHLGPELGIPRLLRAPSAPPIREERRTVPTQPTDGTTDPTASPSDDPKGPHMISEGKTWEEILPANQTNPVTGSALNPNAYAATASMTYTCEAFRILFAHAKNGGKRMSGEAQVKSLALCLSNIVAAAQQQLGVKVSLQDGSNTRLRAALYATLEVAPPPLDSPEATKWEGWMSYCIQRIITLFRIATDVWEAGQVSQPYADLVAAIAAPDAQAA